jgi:hypothetical protein
VQIFHDECELIEDDAYDLFTAETDVERRREKSRRSLSPFLRNKAVAPLSWGPQEHKAIV